MFVLRLDKYPCLWSCRVSAEADMDEYDELFEIQDDFDDQFADELEAMAQMEGERLCQPTNFTTTFYVFSQIAAGATFEFKLLLT